MRSASTVDEAVEAACAGDSHGAQTPVSAISRGREGRRAPGAAGTCDPGPWTAAVLRRPECAHVAFIFQPFLYAFEFTVLYHLLVGLARYAIRTTQGPGHTAYHYLLLPDKYCTSLYSRAHGSSIFPDARAYGRSIMLQQLYELCYVYVMLYVFPELFLLFGFLHSTELKHLDVAHLYGPGLPVRASCACTTYVVCNCYFACSIILQVVAVGCDISSPRASKQLYGVPHAATRQDDEARTVPVSHIWL